MGTQHQQASTTSIMLTLAADLAGLAGCGGPVAADALMERWAAAACAWQIGALAAYGLEARADGAQLRAELAARLHGLTGCALQDGAITADRGAQRATATLDGVVFQLRGHELVVLRPCAHCGTGRFASPRVGSRADLGHALSGWQPYHEGCAPEDPATDTGW
jgi:hypothetical protein